jgi:hypothetical protein
MREMLYHRQQSHDIEALVLERQPEIRALEIYVPNVETVAIPPGSQVFRRRVSKQWAVEID